MLVIAAIGIDISGKVISRVNPVLGEVCSTIFGVIAVMYLMRLLKVRKT